MGHIILLHWYGETNGNYGFLDGDWGNWDIKKAKGGNLEVDIGGTLKTVVYNSFASELTVNNGIESVKNGSDGASSGSYLRVVTASGTTNIWMWQLGASNQFDLWNYNAGGSTLGWQKALTFTTENLNASFAGTGTFVGEVGTTISGAGFRVRHAGTTTLQTTLNYDGIYGYGAQHLYIYSTSQEIKFYPAGTLRATMKGDIFTYVGDITTSGGSITATKGTSSVQLTEYDNGAMIWMDGSNGDFAGSDYFGLMAVDATTWKLRYVTTDLLTVSSTGNATFAGNVGIGETANATYPLMIKKDSNDI